MKCEHGEPIVQEYVSHDGGHFSVGTLFDENSESVAIHVYEELKQYPASGGPAVEARSVPVEPWVDGMLESLRAIGWVGPRTWIMAPFDDETYKLLEVNPRFWMLVGLTIRSGIDVPRIILSIVNGNNITLAKSYQTGLRYRWVLPNEVLLALSNDLRFYDFRKLFNFRNGPTCYGV